MTTLTALIQNFYKQSPDRDVLVLQHAGMSDTVLSYRDLLTGANDYAKFYAAQGIEPGEVIVLILQHGRELVFAFWGAILYGAIPSIMPFLTEKLSPERYREDLATLISVTHPVAIVTYPEFIRDVQVVLREQDSVRVIIDSSNVVPTDLFDIDSLFGLSRQPDDIVLLQHSSGTTGLQKGVALSHRAVLNQLKAYGQAISFSSEDVIVSWLPLYHDMGLIAGFIMPILLGAKLVMMSPFDWVRAPYRLLQSVSRYRGTLSWMPNFAYNFCAQKIRERYIEGVDLSSWRAIINCSEPVRYESHEIFYHQFAKYGLRQDALQTCYAMAENVFGVTQSNLSSLPKIDEIDRETYLVHKIAHPLVDGLPSIKMMSSGQPIANTKVRVLDEKGQDLPDRTIGEIALLSDCMLTGYYNRNEITRKAFVDGWYLTGDLGYVADGDLYVTGRKKDMIIVGGKNIYPQDIELLACDIEGIHAGRTVAFGIFDNIQGTEDVVLVAETDIDDSDERQRIANELRQYVTKNSAVSLRNVHLVSPRWILKTSSGKVARSANREKYLKEYLGE
jgi:fatty-acyl-CoA synthase